MPIHKRDVPCAECPFRKTSAPGWLGSSSAKEFMDCVMHDVDMPCHMDIDYMDRKWETTQYPTAARCAGSLIFLRNILKAPRPPDMFESWKQVRTSDLVFESVDEFMAHHNIPINLRYAMYTPNMMPTTKP